MIIIKKKFIFNFLNFKMYIFKNSLFLKFINYSSLILFKININNIIFINNKFYFKKKKNFNIFFFQFKNYLNKFIYNYYKYYSKIYNIGLGYKNFIYKKNLFLLLGDANYYKLKIPKEILIKCKKNQIYFFSIDKLILFNYINKIKNIKNLNIYKGKGLINFQNFKFMKLKIGKKRI